MNECRTAAVLNESNHAQTRYLRRAILCGCSLRLTCLRGKDPEDKWNSLFKLFLELSRQDGSFS